MFPIPHERYGEMFMDTKQWFRHVRHAYAWLAHMKQSYRGVIISADVLCEINTSNCVRHWGLNLDAPLFTYKNSNEQKLQNNLNIITKKNFDSLFCVKGTSLLKTKTILKRILYLFDGHFWVCWRQHYETMQWTDLLYQTKH